MSLFNLKFVRTKSFSVLCSLLEKTTFTQLWIFLEVEHVKSIFE
jgi:hypothetical protein